jgi:hypothetical protein
LIPEEGSSWQVPDFALDIDEDPEVVQSSLNWLDAELAMKLSSQFKEIINELQEQSRSAVSELLLAEQEKERAKKWVRKSRSELGKTESRQRGLRRILDELDSPSKTEVKSV